MMGLPMIMERSWQRYFFHLNFLLSAHSLLEETVPEICSGPHPPPLSSYRPFNAKALNGFWRTLAVFYHRFFALSTSAIARHRLNGVSWKQWKLCRCLSWASGC